MNKELTKGQIKRIKTLIKNSGFRGDASEDGFDATNKSYNDFNIYFSNKDKVHLYCVIPHHIYNLSTAKKINKEFNNTVKLAIKIDKIINE